MSNSASRPLLHSRVSKMAGKLVKIFFLTSVRGNALESHALIPNRLRLVVGMGAKHLWHASGERIPIFSKKQQKSE